MRQKPYWKWSYSDIIDEVLKIGDTAACRVLLDSIARSSFRHNPEFKQKKHTLESARALLASNLGYFAGYYDNATAAKIMKLCKTRHPIFGTAEQMARVKPEEAQKKGMEMGSKARKRERCKNRRQI